MAKKPTLTTGRKQSHLFNNGDRFFNKNDITRFLQCLNASNVFVSVFVFK